MIENEKDIEVLQMSSIVDIVNKLANENRSYVMNVSEPWLSFIKSGQKTVEGRLNGRDMKAGDMILFGDDCTVRIVDVHVYSSFREMLETEGVNKVLPGVASVDDGVDVYRQFYTKEEEREFGVMAILIK